MPPQVKSKQSTQTVAAKSRRKRTLIWSVATVLVVGGGITAAVLFNKAKGQNPLEKFTPDKSDPPELPPANPAPSRPFSSGGARPVQKQKTDTVFPLRRGMKGDRVELLQKGLNRQFQAGLDTDGIWGRKTQKALEKHKVATPITSAAWNQMLRFMGFPDPYGTAPAVANTGTISPARLAQALAVATNDRKAGVVLAALGQMTSVQDYRNVSDLLSRVSQYKTRDKFGNRVNRNLVNVLMADRMPWSFTNRTAFASELRRIGLKQRGETWSLSGVGRILAYAHVNTIIAGEGNVLQNVPQGTFIGEVLARSPHKVTVRTPKGHIAYVDPNSIAVTKCSNG